MISVTNAVEEILSKNSLVSQILELGLLNMSEYARHIHPEVEKLTFKKVNKQTIVTCLSRLRDKIEPTKTELWQIDDIQLKYPLSYIVYSKSISNNQNILNLHKQLDKDNKMINVIQGNTELSLFINFDLEFKVLEIFGAPLYKRSQVVAVILKFSPTYMEQPGFVFAVVRSIFLAGINLIEVLSTYTEITIFINFSDTQNLIETLNKNFKFLSL